MMDSKKLMRQPSFIALSAAVFVSGVNLRLFDALLPNVAEYFDVGVSQTAIVVTAFTLAYGLFQIVHGPMGDRFGKLRIVGYATLLAALASAGCAFAPSLRALMWLRFVSGIGAAAIIPLSLAWIGDNTDYESRQLVLGRFISFLLLGQVLGPAMGGFLAEYVSWREVFYILALIFAIVSLVLLWDVRRLKLEVRETSGLSVFSAYLKILKNAPARAVLGGAFFEGVVFYGSFAFAGAYLKNRFSLDYLLIGAVLACYGLGGITYTLFVRRLKSRMGERGFIGLGVSILVVCFISMTFITKWQALIPLFSCIGFSFFLFHNTLQTRATEMVPEYRGMAVTLFAFCLFTGQAAGVWLFGAAVDRIGYQWSYVISGLLIALLGLWFLAHPISVKNPASPMSNPQED